jgi:hypothetical protein
VLGNLEVQGVIYKMLLENITSALEFPDDQSAIDVIANVDGDDGIKYAPMVNRSAVYNRHFHADILTGCNCGH